MRRYAIVLLVVVPVTVLSFVARADDSPATAMLDPDGRPDQDLVKVDNARYYVWREANGWHIRTAAKGFLKFKGAIKLHRGTFGKVRQIGLETRGKYADRWAINASRNELRFEIYTGGSFDGFDFDVRGKDAEIEYDLRIGEAGRRMQRRIFVGRNSAHPEKSTFTLPAAD
ncbi:hypothetical protein Mal4_34430 [Maioricimonas rarisocia]|uniref:Uncharacterized protein n=2 Tax=Maioricimonas rarisocia TaxID=2528026 RepID=A0A517Z9E7_9PLAN|nr:hypothetical protein Mal4_34430 [Maioricimonas rarisocia]